MYCENVAFPVVTLFWINRIVSYFLHLFFYEIRIDFGHVVLVWKYIVNWRYMETEMVVSAARLFFASSSGQPRLFPEDSAMS
jgi:hypothetical protein